jgi:hypothetical protein
MTWIGSGPDVVLAARLRDIYPKAWVIYFISQKNLIKAQVNKLQSLIELQRQSTNHWLMQLQKFDYLQN